MSGFHKDKKRQKRFDPTELAYLGAVLPPAMPSLACGDAIGRDLSLRTMAACASDHHLTASVDAKALIDACAEGDEVTVRNLLKLQGVCPDHTNASGWTALMVASTRSHVGCTRLLLEHGAEVDRANKDGVTALILACIADSHQCAVLLCAYGASRSATNKFGRAAAYFARQNNPHLARWLERTRHWCSPLHYLDDGLSLERTQALLEAGVSPHARVPGVVGAPSPLDIALELERAGEAPAGSPAALVLLWWRERLAALAMGTHSRLGRRSPVRVLGGMPEVLELVAHHLAYSAPSPKAEAARATDAQGCAAVWPAAARAARPNTSPSDHPSKCSRPSSPGGLL